MRILAVVVALSVLDVQVQAAYLLVPPTAQEILNVLGPDASGLRLRSEVLPDLFTLTASRLEEDPKTFIIEEPYLSGHWRGGKAIIEYARDLSYTQVSIYDKKGQRQRIYSVRSHVQEQRDEARLKAALIAQKEHAALDQPMAVENMRPLPATPPVDPDADRPRRRHPVKEEPEPEEEPRRTAVKPAVTPDLVAVKNVLPPGSGGLGEGAHMEWDEARGAYVPVKVKVIAMATPTTAPKVAWPSPSRSVASTRAASAPTSTFPPWTTFPRI